MMTMQSYYGGEYDSFNRTSHRIPISAGHYDRTGPYTYPHYGPPPPHDLRSDYPSQPQSAARTVIQEQNQENNSPGHNRRRIQVACARCRRRKIRCTGPDKHGRGCTGCQSAGAEISACTFDRVNSQEVAIIGVDVLPGINSMASNTPSSGSCGSSTLTALYSTTHHQRHHRPSLPMLQTRSAYPEPEAYNASPVEDYTYSSPSMPRHESYGGSYSAESFRPYASGSYSAPVTSTGMYYEPGTPFSFGNLQAASSFAQTATGRLSSVAADLIGPLNNMGSLGVTLPVPAQTVQERQLPFPYRQQQEPSYTSAEVPQIRPLVSLPETQSRMPVNGIHTRSGMPWSVGNPPVSRSGSITTLPTMLPGMSGAAPPSAGPSVIAEPTFGYQFSASSASPEHSPAIGPALSESFSSTSSSSTAGSRMAPPDNVRYLPNSTGSEANAMAYDDEQRLLSSSSQESTASLYTFSAGSEVSARATPVRQTALANNDYGSIPHHYSQTPLRQPQPQHAASIDELHRRSHEQQEQRDATAHRMSVSNLSARY